MYRIFLYLLVLLASFQAFPQTDTAKWGRVNKSYCLPVGRSGTHGFTIAINKPTDVLVKPLFAAYHYLISEPDGDRCPFSPSCSSFFIQATEQASLPAAILLTADRLTRDANFINRKRLYQSVGNTGKLNDPVSDHIVPVTDEK